MKKLNKKGFTLAELLIVIAIIAILIAIAIPVFAGQLENAKLQADHANMRSAYAMAQVASIDGNIFLDGGDIPTPIASMPVCYYTTTGTVSKDATNLYVLKATGSETKCADSQVCAPDKGATHLPDNNIKLSYAGGKVTVTLEKKAP